MNYLRYEIDEEGVVNCYFDFEKAKNTALIPKEIKEELAERGALLDEVSFHIALEVPYKDTSFIEPYTNLLSIRRNDKCTRLIADDTSDYASFERKSNDIKKNGYYTDWFYELVVSYEYDVPGCILSFSKKYSVVNDNDLLFKIYPKGLLKGNYPSDEIYIQHFRWRFVKNSYSYSWRLSGWKRREWFFQTGDIVKADYVVCKESIDDEYYEYKAMKDGFLEQLPSYSENYIFKVYRDEDCYLDEKNIYHFNPDVKKDPFTKEVSVKWKGVSAYGGGFTLYSEKIRIKLSFQFYDNKSYVVINYNIRKNDNGGLNFRVNKGDIFSFLFEDESVIDFKIKETPYSLNMNDNTMEVKFLLYKEDSELFLNHKIIQWKFSQSKFAKQSIIGVLENDEYYSKYMKTAFQKYMQSFIEVLKTEIPDYSLPLKNAITNNKTTEGIENVNLDTCYVYLMLDTTNGSSKIGISNKPEYREHTLQSEKPTIELVCAKLYPSRKIALAIESALHSCYEEKHVRGEWFKLDASDIEMIKETLK